MDSDEDMLENTTVLEEGSREVTVRGETVRLQFNKTQGTESGKIYWEVLGIVQGNENPTFVMLKLLEEAFPEEEIIRRFENIQ